MSLALERTVADTPGLLDPDERIVAAGRGQTIPGTESAEVLPPTTVWAVSQRRLFVFDAMAERPRRGMPRPTIVFDIAGVVASAHTEHFDDRDALLVVVARGHPATVVMDRADARAVAAGITEVLREIASATDPADGATGESGRTSIVADPTGGDDVAAHVRSLLAAGDGAEASRVFGGVPSATARERILRHLTGPELVAGLEAWVAAEPSSPHGYLARGANTVWRARRGRTCGSAPELVEDLRAAEADLLWAVELDFADPVPFTPLICSGVGLRIPVEELYMRLDESVRRRTGMPGAHLEMLLALGPWGVGSPEEMLAFAAAVAQGAPVGSPLHALVPLAHLLVFDTELAQLRRSRSLSSDALKAIDTARAMSVDSEGWTDGVETIEVRNVFALAAVHAGKPDVARADMARAGGVVTRVPWSLVTGADESFRTIDPGPAGSGVNPGSGSIPSGG